MVEALLSAKAEGTASENRHGLPVNHLSTEDKRQIMISWRQGRIIIQHVPVWQEDMVQHVKFL